MVDPQNGFVLQSSMQTQLRAMIWISMLSAFMARAQKSEGTGNQYLADCEDNNLGYSGNYFFRSHLIRYLIRAEYSTFSQLHNRKLY